MATVTVTGYLGTPTLVCLSPLLNLLALFLYIQQVTRPISVVPNGVGTDPWGSLVRSRGSMEGNFGFGGRWGSLACFWGRWGNFALDKNMENVLHKLYSAKKKESVHAFQPNFQNRNTLYVYWFQCFPITKFNF